MKTKISENQIISDFGKEWKEYDNNKLSIEEKEKIFFDYFYIFPWDKINLNSIGFDAGCGSGRWSYFISKYVKEIHCIEPSEAINIAKKNLSRLKNCFFYNEKISEISIKDNSMDFGFSLGVLHHTINTLENLIICTNKLKKGSPFLIYLYYRFDNKPKIYFYIWKISNLLRLIISKLPFLYKKIITLLIALLIYLPFARFSKLLNIFNIKNKFIPLYYYQDKSFYVMKNDALDRFGTRLEKRYTKNEIKEMMTRANLINIKFSDKEPFWVAVGYKK